MGGGVGTGLSFTWSPALEFHQTVRVKTFGIFWLPDFPDQNPRPGRFSFVTWAKTNLLRTILWVLFTILFFIKIS